MVLLTDGKMCEKLMAHSKGLKHYALSVLIFNDRGELLLQKRAKEKYHSGDLWTNACCTHPLSTDIQQIQDMAAKRLNYEMSLNCELEYVFSFSYQMKCDYLIENEYDFVFIGKTNAEPVINLKEVSDYKWEHPEHIYKDIKQFPHHYTSWFHLLFEQWNIYRATEKADAAKKAILITCFYYNGN